MDINDPVPAHSCVGLRYSGLSIPWQELIRLCQRVNYGSIQELHFRDAQPILSSPPQVLVDVKLDSDQTARPEAGLADFELGGEVCRLISQLQKFGAGVIEHIEVRAGIPRRIVFRGPPPSGSQPGQSRGLEISERGFDHER